MNVARFNFSHGSHEEHQKKLDIIKKLRQEMDIPLATLLDTKGPEIRLGQLKDGKAFLEDGDIFTLTTEDILGDKTRASISFKDCLLYTSSGVGEIYWGFMTFLNCFECNVDCFFFWIGFSLEAEFMSAVPHLVSQTDCFFVSQFLAVCNNINSTGAVFVICPWEAHQVGSSHNARLSFGAAQLVNLSLIHI